MAQVYKNPLDAAESMKVPEYNREHAVAYFNNYGDGFVDDAYDNWLKEKGRPAAARRPLNPEFAKTSLAKQSYFEPTTNRDVWLNDDEWLKEMWAEEYYPYIDEYIKDKTKENQ